MSADPDKGAACPIDDKVTGFAEGGPSVEILDPKKKRSVRFPNENQLVTQYFEPANPWHDVPTTSRSQLAHEYLGSCRRHNTTPIDSVLHQIRELPEACIGGGARAARLSLADCSLESAAPADALEALLRKVQFRRIDLDHADLDDEGAEALFDMIEYYESACVISITGPRQFGIRGWQSASRMIKKSAELSEIEVAESALESSHAPVLARALRPITCTLRALCLQRSQLSGEALMCLVIAMKTNTSIRELRLPDNSLTAHDAQQLGSLLRFNTNIQLLDLSNNQIQDIGVGHITDALVEQAAQTPPSAGNSPISPQLYPMSGADGRGLAFLVLWNNQLTRNCAHYLSKALRSSHSLCVLNIGRNAVGTDTVRALQSGASQGGALLSLGLQCARLGPEAGAPLADLLRADTKLQRLDLRDNRLGPAGLQALLTAMSENHTLTQIDLDDPAESSTLRAEESEAASVARLTRDIRALCRRNEPPASEPERRAHRKLSLTCHTACLLNVHSNSSGGVCNTKRSSRLRSPLPSPAPSPAGSPIPHHQQNVQVNRFSVTRVTPERETSESYSGNTPTRPGYCPAPSRFKVMQVTEPPSIQVHPAQKRAVSRFSVTRNYDSIYNPSPRESPSASPTPSASPPTNSPSPSISPCPSDTSYSDNPRGKGYSDSPIAEKSYDSPKRDKSFDSPRIEKGYCDTPRSEKSYRDTPRVENPKASVIGTSIGTPTLSKDIRKPIDNKSSVEISCLTYADNLSHELTAEVPTTTIFSTNTMSSSSIDITGASSRESLRETRYSCPSITTLSGALFSQSVPEMSTTTVCPRESLTESAGVNPNGIPPYLEVSAASSEISLNTSSSVPISSSRSEPIFGPALFIEPTVPPTVVPNSRFSISPSPVSFITEDSYCKKPHKRIEKTEAKVIASQENIRNDSFRNKTDFTSEIERTQSDTIRDPSNRSILGSQEETNLCRTVVDEKVQPVVTCDMKSVLTNVPSYTGGTEIPSGIDINIQTELTTDIIKDDNDDIAELMKNLTIADNVPNKIEQKSKDRRFEMVSIPEVRPEDTQPSIYVNNQSSVKQSDKLSTKQIDNTPIVKQNDVRISETRKDDLLSKEIVISDKTTDTLNVVAKEIEKPDVVLKNTAQVIEKRVTSEAKAVEFACKPENVIFFISDEPICRSDKSIDRDFDVKDDINAGKTYSDIVKTEPFKDKMEQLSYEKQRDDEIFTTETKLVKNSVQVSDSDKVDVKAAVTVKTESVKDNAAKVHSDKDFVNIDDIIIKDDKTMQKIEAITEDLGNLIKEMKDMSAKGNNKCTVDVGSINTNIVPGNFNRDVVLKKNKSESSLDSPDLEVSRLMNKKLVGSPFRDSNSSLEISGSSMESLNAIENIPKPIIIQKSIECDTELDRRKETIALFTESSVESTSEVTPVNQNFLNTSVSSNESVSPIFGKTKKIHGSLSSLEASVSSLDSKQDRVMVTSADSGIEHSLQNPSDNNDASSNEGTLTHNSSLKETVKKTENLQETLTSSPKRVSSLLDVPALKSKGLDRMRKISWVAPSPSFHIPKEPEKVKEEKPSHLEKLLSLFQHPTSLFSRSQTDDERKSASNTPPRKDSSLTSSFWSWGSAIESYKEEKEDSSEATDSTLSERVQVSFVDESFSKKLDSKTPSTDTDNTLSEYQSFSQNIDERVTDITTDLVQKCLDLSLKTDDSSADPRVSDTLDLSKPNDFNNETGVDRTLDTEMPVEINENKVKLEDKDVKLDPVRPRSFAAVLKASGSENTLEKQVSPETGQLVDKLPVKVIRGIKENISPENTLTSSMTNTQAIEMMVKHQPIVNAVWEIPAPLLEKHDPKIDDVKSDLAPIATIEETCDIAADNFSSETMHLDFIDDAKVDIEVRSNDDQVSVSDEMEARDTVKGLGIVDLGKDALSYLMFENRDFEPDSGQAIAPKEEEGSLAQELKEAAIKEMIDLSPELVIDEASEVFPAKESKPGLSPVIPERAKLKKSNSLEDLSKRQEKEEKSPKTKTIAFKVPETSPRDIPERRSKLRSRSGSSPKSLPECLNRPCPLSKMDSVISKKKKRVSSLGKMARDSLLALNMSEEEMAEFRRSYKLTSVESLRSLESVSEDANSQSGTSFDSRCRACLRTSQESLMSLDSINEDCKCEKDRDKRIV